tara:strand:- start:103 stop:375 length:273 start_codon:yes stop_codon:yes gene_type:complete
MGVKKIARPLNKAKNDFVKWLKKNKATDIDVYEGPPALEWDYYRSVSGFIGDDLFTVYFEMWYGQLKISYSDESNYYDDMTIEEFMQIID